MIQDTLNKQINEALKKGEAVRVSTLRLLSNALHNEWIAKQKDLTEEDELAVLRRQAKQREEAIEALRQAQGKLTSSSEADLEARIEKERQELAILKEFLPAQMGEEEIEKIVDQVIGESGDQGFGEVMKKVMEEVKGKANGEVVAGMVKRKLIG